jgi:putative DNA primase/helicase
VTSSAGNDGFLFNFDPQAVAAQILAQAATPLPAQAGEMRLAAVQDNPATVAGLLPDTLSDRGNAKLFVKLYANDYRHVPGLGWFRWDATRWQMDEDDAVVWAAGDLAENLAVSDPRGVFTPAALQQHRRRALSTSGMNAMLTQAKSAPGMVLNASLLDADPYVLCTPSGVVDLRTGLLRTADPNKDFHSRSTSTGPTHGPTPRWDRFLADTFGVLKSRSARDPDELLSCETSPARREGTDDGFVRKGPPLRRYGRRPGAAVAPQLPRERRRVRRLVPGEPGR